MLPNQQAISLVEAKHIGSYGRIDMVFHFGELRWKYAAWTNVYKGLVPCVKGGYLARAENYFLVWNIPEILPTTGRWKMKGCAARK